jgi:hypothetical protein
MQAAQASAVQKFGRREKKWFSKHFLWPSRTEAWFDAWYPHMHLH